VEVKIGIQSAPRELVLDTNETTEQIEQALRTALADGGVFALSDDKGGKVLVPTDKLAYLELGGNETRRVGFGSSL
jgi:Protein of unknown function (DUF3107)